MLELLSSKKSFDLPWIGSKRLNRLGIHNARIKLADTFHTLRQLQITRRQNFESQLNSDGVIAIQDFLPQKEFLSLAAEAHDLVNEFARQHPLPLKSKETGFGSRMDFTGGFDRFDGSTLNRFIALSEATTPNCLNFVRDQRLENLYCRTAGCRPHQEKFWLYQMRHGIEKANPDIQKTWHRDTFHSAIKLWYFIDEATIDDGPFQYIKGSHKMTLKRHQWEYKRANKACQTHEKGGAFRFSQADIDSLDLNTPSTLTVPANTLVLADIRGIHRRGPSKGERERLSIYASHRPHPFSPVAY